MPLFALLALALGLALAAIPDVVADPVPPSRVGDGVPFHDELDHAAPLEETAMQALRTSTTVLWRWEAPEPVDPDVGATLAVRLGADVVAGLPALQPTVAPATVDSISDDRRRLTLTEALDGTTSRAAGDVWGAAFLVTPAGGVFPARVSEIGADADVVTLADPLPRRVDPTGATIQWASWFTTFTAADVTATARRDVHWDVEWQPLHAGGAGGEATVQVDEGRIVVTRKPFDTRVTDASFCDQYSEIASTTAGRDNSRAGVLRAARDRLVLDLRPHLRPLGLWEHDVEGTNLDLAHKTLAASMVLDRTDPERAKRLRERYVEDFDRGLRSIWADLNADGKLDAGEEVEVTGAVTLAPARLSDLFASVDRPDAPVWPRGRHR